jgi:hypothetical protein
LIVQDPWLSGPASRRVWRFRDNAFGSIAPALYIALPGTIRDRFFNNAANHDVTVCQPD